MAEETLVGILGRLARAMPRNADVVRAYELAVSTSGQAVKSTDKDPRNGTSYWAAVKRKQRAKKAAGE